MLTIRGGVFRDLNGIWKQISEDGDYVFESNRGFSRVLRGFGFANGRRWISPSAVEPGPP